MAHKKRAVNSFSSNIAKKQKLDNDAALSSTKYTFASPYPQRFSIPGHFVYYLTKNVKNSKVYLKLIQTCKHYFNQNPIIIGTNFNNDKDGLLITHTDLKKIEIKKPNGLTVTEEIKRSYAIKVEDVEYKIWITGEIKLDEFIKNLEISNFISKIYYSQVEILRIDKCTLTYPEYLTLASSKCIKSLTFHDFVLKNDDESDMSVEALFTELPNVEKNFISLRAKDGFLNIDNAAQKLLEFPKFDRLKSFYLHNVTVSFDLETFGKFAKKHNEAKFLIYYMDDYPRAALKNIRLVIQSFDETFPVEIEFF